MKKTLGGDRLGSGQKIEVDLHGYERSTHNLGKIWRSTMAAGTLVPFLKLVALPGDTFDINLGCDVKTHPTIGPLFGSYKVQLDVFQCPIRLYQGQLHNNKLGIGMNMAAVKLPIIRLTSAKIDTAAEEFDPLTFDWDNAQVNPSHLIAYLGIRGVGISHEEEPAPIVRDFNGIPFLAYWDIYKNYYANKQEEIGALLHTPLPPLTTTVTAITEEPNSTNIPQIPATPAIIPMQYGSGLDIAYTGASPIPSEIMFKTSIGNLTYEQLTSSRIDNGTSIIGAYNFTLYGNINIYAWDYIEATQMPTLPPNVVTFDLNQIDVMREKILGATQITTPFIVNQAFISNIPYMDTLNFTAEGRSPLLNTQEGLALKTYQSDLFNNWLSTEWIDGVDGITQVTAIDTSGGSFTLDTLNLSKKVYDMLNRIAVSGGSYDDWLDAVWAHDRYMRCESPMYMGGLQKELVFQEVVSNSESTSQEGPTQPLGTLAGKGIMAQRHKGGKVTIKVDEPSYILGIVSLTPRIDYSQGNDWDIHLATMDDFHKPALDEIGFQELITERMAWWTTYKPLAGVWTTQSAGKQPAWIEYMTDINKVLGNFAIKNNEMFMILNRRYEMEYTGTPSIKDLTTYIDPGKYNHIFAQTALDAQNYWVQISTDITARRKMSAKVMPNL